MMNFGVFLKGKKISITACLIILAVVVLSIVALSVNVSAATGVTVRTPNYPVRINGSLINDHNAKYPLLTYKGITYIPLTTGYCNVLGISITWDNSAGLTLSKLDQKSYCCFENTKKDSFINATYSAAYPNFTIRINGKVIDNSKEDYPLLVFRDITYFPLTWRYAAEEFGLTTAWDNTDGLSINSAAYQSSISKMHVSTRTGEGQKMTIREVVQKIQPATVQIATDSKYGSGFFVSSKGLTVTNAHVVRGSQWIKVITANGKEYSAAIQKIDNAKDIALLNIIGNTEVPFIDKFCPIEKLSPGDEVIVFGNPLQYTGTVTSGMINAIRDDSASEAWQGTIKIIQYDAITAPGSSGGAAVNLYGECIGIHFAGLTDSALRFNFAIPAQYYYDVLNWREDYSLKDDVYSYFTEQWAWNKKINESMPKYIGGSIYESAYNLKYVAVPLLNEVKQAVTAYTPKYEEVSELKRLYIESLEKIIVAYNTLSSALQSPWSYDTDVTFVIEALFDHATELRNRHTALLYQLMDKF